MSFPVCFFSVSDKYSHHFRCVFSSVSDKYSHRFRFVFSSVWTCALVISGLCLFSLRYVFSSFSTGFLFSLKHVFSSFSACVFFSLRHTFSSFPFCVRFSLRHVLSWFPLCVCFSLRHYFSIYFWSQFNTCCVSWLFRPLFFRHQPYIIDCINDRNVPLLISLYFMRNSSCSLISTSIRLLGFICQILPCLAKERSCVWEACCLELLRLFPCSGSFLVLYKKMKQRKSIATIILRSQGLSNRPQSLYH